MSREAQLIDLYEECREDPDPALEFLRSYTTGVRLVPGEGSVRPRVFIIGEAPGATENLRVRPFVGASGRVLRDLMAQCHLHTDEFYEGGTGLRRDSNTFITNAIKYRPPGNRTPTEAEIEASRPYLRREWKILGAPPVIVTAGSVALFAILSRRSAVGKMAGVPQLLPDDKTWLYPMFHPSFALQNKRFRPVIAEQWNEFSGWLTEQKVLTTSSG